MSGLFRKLHFTKETGRRAQRLGMIMPGALERGELFENKGNLLNAKDSLARRVGSVAPAGASLCDLSLLVM